MELINPSNSRKNPADLPLPLKLKLIAIKHIQTKIQKLNNELQTELTEVLQKYHAQIDSIQLNSNDIIEAKTLPNLETTPNLGDYFFPSEIIRAQEIPLTSKRFENYWFTVLVNSKLQVAILPEEEDILLCLDKVMLNTMLSKREKHCKLAFFFKENSFFSNREIICNLKYDRDNNLTEAKSTKIYWYPNQNIYRSGGKQLDGAGGFFKLFKRYDKNSQNEMLHKYRIDITFIATELIHEIIPHSIHLYMGVSKSANNSKKKSSKEQTRMKTSNLLGESLLNDHEESKNEEG